LNEHPPLTQKSLEVSRHLVFEKVLAVHTIIKLGVLLYEKEKNGQGMNRPAKDEKKIKIS